MPDRKKGRRLGIFLVAAVAVVADLFAIASAQAVTTKFPQPLHLIQRYPWWSVAIFTVVGVVLAVLLYLHDDAADDHQGGEEVNVDSTTLKRSPVWVLKGTHAKFRKSKLVDSAVTVSNDNRPAEKS